MNMNPKQTEDPSIVRANPGKKYYSYPLHAVVFLLTLLYFRYEWRTFSGFVTSIDRGVQFLQDFTNYYYPMSRQIVHDPVPITGYFYPSFFALILFPIGMLPLPAAQIVWGAFQGFCLLALLYLPLRYWVKIPPPGSALYLLLFATSYPILNNFKWGQVSVPITLGILAVFLFFEKNRPIAAGVLLAFITAIKFYPLVFVVLFLVKRDFRALAAFIISFSIFYFVIPAFALGLSNWLEFEKIAGSEITSAGWVARDVNSQYAAHVGLRWFEIIFHRTGGDVIRDVVTIAGSALAFSCIVMAWMLYKKRSRESRVISVAAIFLCLPFVLNTSWPHYFAYLPFCQSVFLANAIVDFRSSNLTRKALLALPILSMLISSVFVFNLFPDWSVYNYYGMLFLSNLILLPSLYATQKSVDPK
jgi:hypothetical protein